MTFYGIKDGNVWDICGKLVNKRTANDGVPLTKEELEAIKYIELPRLDIVVGDTWDFDKNESLRDSPQRFEPREIPKTNKELMKKIKELETRIEQLEQE